VRRVSIGPLRRGSSGDDRHFRGARRASCPPDLQGPSDGERHGLRKEADCCEHNRPTDRADQQRLGVRAQKPIQVDGAAQVVSRAHHDLEDDGQYQPHPTDARRFGTRGRRPSALDAPEGYASCRGTDERRMLTGSELAHRLGHSSFSQRTMGDGDDE
jgi:hypothetical protein